MKNGQVMRGISVFQMCFSLNQAALLTAHSVLNTPTPRKSFVRLLSENFTSNVVYSAA